MVGGIVVSLGYAGRAVLVDSDGRSALYIYECENWNRKDNAPRLDGEIYIEFEPIATARKIVRTKRYPQGIPLSGMAENVDFYELLEAGSLSVRNCSNATRCDINGIDLQSHIEDRVPHSGRRSVSREGLLCEVTPPFHPTWFHRLRLSTLSGGGNGCH